MMLAKIHVHGDRGGLISSLNTTAKKEKVTIMICREFKLWCIEFQIGNEENLIAMGYTRIHF